MVLPDLATSSRRKGNKTAALRPAVLLILLTFLCASLALALDVPRLAGRVNDNAGLLTPETVTKLNKQLADFERSDSTQVVVLTIPSLQGESLEEYSIKVAQAWGIGQKGKDNGVLLLVAKAERKVRIEVGYGLEGKLTDALSGRINHDVIVPAFKKGDFNAGIENGITAIISAVRGEYHQEPAPSDQTDDTTGGVLAVLIIAFFLSLFTPLRALNIRWWLRGGLVSAVSAGFGILFGLAGLALVWLILGGFAIGVLPSLFRGRGDSGGGGFWMGGSGGGSGGGSSDSGFSGGGGSFGGGGSSDSW